MTNEGSLCHVILFLVIGANEFVLMLLGENVLVVCAEHWDIELNLAHYNYSGRNYLAAGLHPQIPSPCSHQTHSPDRAPQWRLGDTSSAASDAVSTSCQSTGTPRPLSSPDDWRDSNLKDD